MLRYSKVQFKTRYLELLEGDISTDSMPFSRCLTEPAPMTQLACMEILREPLHIGYGNLPLAVSTLCWRGTIPDVQLNSLLFNWQDCAKISVVRPEKWDTTKTCGTGCSCLITLIKIIPSPLVLDNAKGSSTNLALVSRGLVAKLLKPTPISRKPLKKLLPIDARPYRSSLVRGRSSFSTPHQPDKNVGTNRRTTSRPLAFVPSQSRLLRRTQFENRSPSYPGSAYL